MKHAGQLQHADVFWCCIAVCANGAAANRTTRVAQPTVHGTRGGPWHPIAEIWLQDIARSHRPVAWTAGVTAYRRLQPPRLIRRSCRPQCELTNASQGAWRQTRAQQADTQLLASATEHARQRALRPKARLAESGKRTNALDAERIQSRWEFESCQNNKRRVLRGAHRKHSSPDLAAT